MITIAHLSDPHLDGSPERLERLARVLDQVATLPDVALVIVTGDIADNGEPAEYAQFFKAFAPAQPMLVVPGNHDLRAPLSRHLSPGPAGYFNSVTTTDGVSLIGLDSLVEHQIHGLLADETLIFAREAIAAAPGPVVLALHHPPVPVGHDFMDQHGLHDSQTLADLVTQHPSVIAVLTGHVHTALATTFAGVPLLGAPGIVSTMRPGSRLDPIADSTAMPGLALHTIHPNGRLTTVFHYLSPDSS